MIKSIEIQNKNEIVCIFKIHSDKYDNDLEIQQFNMKKKIVDFHVSDFYYYGLIFSNRGIFLI